MSVNGQFSVEDFKKISIIESTAEELKKSELVIVYIHNYQHQFKLKFRSSRIVPENSFNKI